jgi:dTDP-4-dehydrorhamnose 3,5-epimerase
MLVEFVKHVDERGTFRRLWSQREAAAANVGRPVVQSSLSVTSRRGTLRGMHFQLPPSREDKIVQCVRGRIFDVALDLRRRSPTYLEHFGAELSEERPRALFIPAGCAHGFLTLADDSAVLYMMTDYYDPALSTGVRWNDPAFGIQWPEQPRELLERDRTYPDFDERTVDGFAAY